MACDFCRQLPRNVVAELNDDLREGESSADELAEQYSCTPEDIEVHERECLYADNDGYSELDRMIRQLDVAAQRSIRKYRENSKNFEAMDHYIALTREKRSTIVAKERLKPSDELVKEIAQKILSPLIKRMVVVHTEESERLRTELYAIVDASLYTKIDRALKSSLRNTGRRLSTEMAQLVPNLQRILNVEAAPIEDLDLDPEEPAAPEEPDPKLN